MPKGKAHHGGNAAKKKERAVRAAIRRERKAGAYLSPGDPDFKSFSNQLAIQGLKLKDVSGDGNCLFRALSIQVGDRLTNHASLRRDVVHYMREHREEFEPFLENQISFDQYLNDLSKDGEYAGNDAIVAFARCHGNHVVIHQLNAPRMEVHATHGKGKTLHIAYLNGEHYTSVEPILPDDSLPQITPEAKSPPPPATSYTPLSQPLEGGTSDEVLTVMKATGCQDLELIEQSLCENSYDPELAIVELLQLMSLSGTAGPGVTSPSPVVCKVGQGKSGQPQAQREERKERQVQSRKCQPPQRGQHLSNRDRKEEAKAARKLRKKETRKSHHSTQYQEDPVGTMTI